MAVESQFASNDSRIFERVDANVSAPRSLGSPIVSFSSRQRRFA
jgi:hypothetical protein